MFPRILVPALSLGVCLVSARADEKPVDLAEVEVQSTDVVVDGEPVVVICTFGGAEAVDSDAGEPTTCEVVELKDGEGDVVVDGDVGLDPEIRHYSGSEVERGDGEVDPSVMYMTGAGPTTTESAATGEAVLAGGVASSGIEAVSQVQGYVVAAALPKAELRVIRSGSDVVISD